MVTTSSQQVHQCASVSLLSLHTRLCLPLRLPPTKGPSRAWHQEKPPAFTTAAHQWPWQGLASRDASCHYNCYLPAVMAVPSVQRYPLSLQLPPWQCLVSRDASCLYTCCASSAIAMPDALRSRLPLQWPASQHLLPANDHGIA